MLRRIVFSEAQAFGCPSITYAVGGTSTAVLDRETGIVLPLTATAEDFARRVEQLVRDPASYETMSRNARRRYEQSANWDAWAETILRLAPVETTPSRNHTRPWRGALSAGSVRICQSKCVFPTIDQTRRRHDSSGPRLLDQPRMPQVPALRGPMGSDPLPRSDSSRQN